MGTYTYRYPYRYHLYTCHMTWHREHGLAIGTYIQVPKGTEVAHRGHKENGGYPWVPLYRYPYRYHLYTCHMTWHDMAGTLRYLYTGTYIGTSRYTDIHPHINIYENFENFENFGFISRDRTCNRQKVASNVIT